MSFRVTAFRRSFALVFLLGLLNAPAAFGQPKDSPVAFSNRDAITTSFVTPPNLGGTGTGAPSDSDQWLKVEIHYGTTAALKAPFLDSVQFKIWIEGRDMLDPQGKPGEGIAVGLTGDVTYINLPAGKDIYGVFYVHPSTLARYSFHSYTDFDRKFDVHAEAYIKGTMVDAVNKNKESDITWYQKLKAVDGLVLRQNQCAFIISDPDHYPAIKLQSQ